MITVSSVSTSLPPPALGVTAVCTVVIPYPPPSWQGNPRLWDTLLSGCVPQLCRFLHQQVNSGQGTGTISLGDASGPSPWRRREAFSRGLLTQAEATAMGCGGPGGGGFPFRPKMRKPAAGRNRIGQKCCPGIPINRASQWRGKESI